MLRHILVIISSFCSFPAAIIFAAEVPDFYKSTVEDVDAVLKTVTKGQVRVEAVTPGGRRVYSVSYGERDPYTRTANFQSAALSQHPEAFARRAESAKPVLLVLAGVARTGYQRLTQSRKQALAAQAQWREAAPAFRDQVRLLIALGKTDDALTRLRHAMELFPGDLELHAMQGDIHQVGMQFSEAIRAYDATLKLKPGYVHALDNLKISHTWLRERQDQGRAEGMLMADMREEFIRQQRFAEAECVQRRLALLPGKGWSLDSKLFPLGMVIRDEPPSSETPGLAVSLATCQDPHTVDDVSALRSLPLRRLDLAGTAVSNEFEANACRRPVAAAGHATQATLPRRDASHQAAGLGGNAVGRAVAGELSRHGPLAPARPEAAGTDSCRHARLRLGPAQRRLTAATRSDQLPQHHGVQCADRGCQVATVVAARPDLGDRPEVPPPTGGLGGTVA